MPQTRSHLSNDIKLSKAELAVLCSIANGLQSKEIAAALCRSKPTVELHVRTLFAKFNAKSRAHLVATALYTGLLTWQDIDMLEQSV